jgi:SPP1 gp7 family putative phage head morphogenesis protein
MAQSSLEAAISRTRASILAHETRISTLLFEAYADVYQYLSEQIDAVLVRIQQLQSEGKEVNAYLIMKLARLDTALDQTAIEIDRYALFANQQIAEGQRFAIILAGNHTRDLILSTVPINARNQIPSNFLRFNPVAVIKAVGRLSSGSPLTALLNQLSRTAVSSVQDAMIKGLVAGKGPSTVAREIRDVLKVSGYRAITIARTEILSSYRQASLESYRQNSNVVTRWRWVCAKQARTCGMCLAMDGREFELETPLGTHPNCRCSMIPITKTWEELGISIPDQKPKLETGEEWFRRQPRNVQLEVLGKTKLELYEAGELNLSNLIGYKEDPAWGPIRWERSSRQIQDGESAPPRKALGRRA